MTVESTTAATELQSPADRPPPRNRMVVAVLSLIGLFIALYLTAFSVGLVPLICGVSSCETVQLSQWAKVGAVPVSLIGIGGYLSLLLTAMFGLHPARQHLRAPGLVMFALSAVGFAYSGFLTYLEASVIHAWCIWCVTSAVLMTAIFLSSLPELFRTRGSF
jgi:uncharacterized membrane protein